MRRVNVAIIGLGGRSMDIVTTCLGIPSLRIAAICDCFAPRCDDYPKRLDDHLKRAKAKVTRDGQHWTTYTDFRAMLDKEKLDGVMVETTTHARAWIVVQAMQAGKDAYIEKPMCLTIAEGRQMVRGRASIDRVTQVGTQQRSMPINNWASDLVKNGALGKVHTVLAPNFVGPDALDRPARPAAAQGRHGKILGRLDQSGRIASVSQLAAPWLGQWWDYDGGGLCFGVTGWGTHSYDQIQRALGTDETGPVEVWLEEPVQVMGTGKYIKGTVGEPKIPG